MSIQAVKSGEFFVTFMARIRFLPSVDPHMSLIILRLGECLVTFLAYIWFLSSKDPHVFPDVTRLGECVFTFLAAICSHPNMKLYVTLQTGNKEFGFRHRHV